MLLGETRKSREQNFRDFFESLQLEYIVAELRYKIYPESKQKNVCNRKNKSLEIMMEKRKRIVDIAIKNKLDTIFEDIFIGDTALFCEEIKARLYETVIPQYGFPNFIYRDENQKNALSEYDKMCYYSVNSIFLVKFIGEGLLTNYDPVINKCSVKINNSVYVTDVSEISRVFK